HPPQDRARSAGSDLHQDGALRRLSVQAAKGSRRQSSGGPEPPKGPPRMRLFGFFHLKSIGGQIAALVVASIVALHLILTVSFLVSRPDRAEAPPDSAHELADAALLLGGTEASERPRLLADIARAFPKIGIE